MMGTSSATALTAMPKSRHLGLMKRLDELRIGYKDLSTQQSSLEDIFVSLVHGTSEDAA
jgi:hypothetical protein